MTKTLEEMLQVTKTSPSLEENPSQTIEQEVEQIPEPQPEQPPVEEVAEQVAEQLTEQEDDSDDIPEHMYTDSGMVGYGDSQIQADIYNLAIRGNIPLVGQTSILDIGAGRGDLLHHIKSQLPSLEVNYIGYENNPLLQEIGTNKINRADLGESAVISGEDFLTAQLEAKFDLVYVIGTLNINYGTEVQPWEYLEMMLRKALDVTELGGNAVFVLLHDTGGVDQYISYPIPNISDLIMKFNMPFSIEYGVIPSVYKLTIRKEPIFITQ